MNNLPDHAPGAGCPKCGRPVDHKRRCWWCHDRECSLCGKQTGSAFIELCITCGVLDGRL